MRGRGAGPAISGTRSCRGLRQAPCPWRGNRQDTGRCARPFSRPDPRICPPPRGSPRCPGWTSCARPPRGRRIGQGAGREAAWRDGHAHCAWYRGARARPEAGASGRERGGRRPGAMVMPIAPWYKEGLVAHGWGPGQGAAMRPGSWPGQPPCAGVNAPWPPAPRLRRLPRPDRRRCPAARRLRPRPSRGSPARCPIRGSAGGPCRRAARAHPRSSA
jgi:hypothetical protein